MLLVSSLGCSTIVAGQGPPEPTATPHPSVPPSRSDEVDLLLVIDNSSSMADKQQIFANSLGQLITSLVSPPCLDLLGGSYRPGSRDEPCFTGYSRPFAPIRSMHLGVISSSLGGVGSVACSETDATRDNDDHGHLLRRAKGGGLVPTYVDAGYLVWDPEQTLSPPGEADLSQLVARAVSIVEGAGEVGCGYEMPLESAYRFLVDPSPYASITKEGGGIPAARIAGLDTEILAERDGFLRDTSIVAVVLLSDENDCSLEVGTRGSPSQDYTVLDAAPFFRASTACASDPVAECCYSCGLPPPSTCSADPACQNPRYAQGEDDVNLRCWHQKQRYGIDFLYPVERYVNAFSRTTIDPDVDTLIPSSKTTGQANPLFSRGRDPALFFMSTIVGVPWQSIVKNPASPDEGILDADGFAQRQGWDVLVGDPSRYVEPTDPIMRESTEPRAGVSDTSPNGGDRPIASPANDLEYACIFPLPEPIIDSPECLSGVSGNPVCQGTSQTSAKAYPGLRELAVLKGLGPQGVVGSICAPAIAPLADPSANLYGYGLIFDALVERMTGTLAD